MNEKRFTSAPDWAIEAEREDEKKLEDLIKGLRKEIDRCRELFTIYDETMHGQATIGARFIQDTLSNAEKAITAISGYAGNDTKEMLIFFEILKNFNMI